LRPMGVRTASTITTVRPVLGVLELDIVVILRSCSMGDRFAATRILWPRLDFAPFALSALDETSTRPGRTSVFSRC
jgi:hypothetical protein